MKAFLRTFAALIVEAWRQLGTTELTSRWTIAFEILCDLALDKLTLHGAVDAINEQRGHA